MITPSGEQIDLRLGDQRAVVVGVGGGLRAYEAEGRQLLDGYREDEMCSAGRGQLLIPWPNRIEDGSYEFGGRTHQLPLTEPRRGNAIHGLCRWVHWSVRQREPARVVIEHLLHPQPGYEFGLALSAEYALSDEGLTVTTTATNVGAEPCPYGCGAHPYLTVGTEQVDAALLRAPAATALHSDGRGIPVRSEPVEGTRLDFRSGRAIGSVELDHAFTDLGRDEDGLARIELAHPEDGIGVTLWLDETHDYVMLFTGDPLPGAARRSLAVEPMTCAPNAFRTGDGLITLEPGESRTSVWGLAPGPI